MSLSVSLGPVRPDELNFVAKSTKTSLRHAPPYSTQSNFIAYARLNPLVNALLADAEVLVARDPRRPSVAHGFIVYNVQPEALSVHFLYVKKDSRRDGVARTLLNAVLVDVPDDAVLEYTFPTERFRSLATSYGFYCPDEEEV